MVARGCMYAFHHHYSISTYTGRSGNIVGKTAKQELRINYIDKANRLKAGTVVSTKSDKQSESKTELIESWYKSESFILWLEGGTNPSPEDREATKHYVESCLESGGLQIMPHLCTFFKSYAHTLTDQHAHPGIRTIAVQV